MSRKIGKVLKHVSSVLIAVVIILAFLFVGVRLFGLKVYTVLSGSMEPAYQTGAIIYVKDVALDELVEGDVITFYLGSGTTATHRIVEVVPDEDNSDIVRYRTKGDANDTMDASLVEGEDIIGSPVFTIPYLGYFISFIQRPPGLYLAIAVGAALVLLVMTADVLSGDKAKKEKNQTE